MIKILLAIIIVSTIQANDLFNKKEKEWIVNNKNVKVAMLNNFQPFSYVKTGKHQGFSVDLLKKVSQISGLTFDIETSRWSEALEKFKNNKVDIISGISYTKTREEFTLFTKPYYEIPTFIFGLKNNLEYKNNRSLKGKKVGVSNSIFYIKKLQEQGINVVEFDSSIDKAKALAFGEIDYFLASYTSGMKAITSQSLSTIKPIDELKNIKKEDLRFGISKSKPELYSIIEKSLSMVEDSYLRELSNKWITVKYENGIDYALVWKILFVLFMVIAYFIYKQYRLRKSIQELGDIIDATMEAIFVSKEGICIDVNKSAVELLGYSSKKEMIGIPLINFAAEDTKEKIKESIKQDDVKPYEGNAVRKNGQVFPALIKGHNLKHKNLRISSVVDITHLKQLESQSKLASMGEMIANIAHQWRQPLSVISTAASGIQLKKEYGILEDHELLGLCTKIDENAQYLSQTIEDFRNFIKGDTAPVRFNLKNDTDSFIKIVDSSIKNYNIQVILDLEEHVELKGYPNDLIQCFINIFNNSKDAFLENNIKEAERFIFISQKVYDNTIEINFKDNAGGIPDTIINKIFEPYFTTKHESQGTGLGLHMSYNLIVKHMEGTIEVKNETYEFNGKDYKGALFTIKLPLR